MHARNFYFVFRLRVRARARVSSMMYTSTMNGGTNRSGGIFAHKHTGLNVVENCEIEITRAHCSEQKTKYII